MPAIIETVAVTAPLVIGGGVAGAALGVMAEKRIHQSVAEKEQQWSEANGEVAEAITAQSLTIREKFKRWAGPVAVGLTAAGAVMGYALAPGASADSQKREVHALVDRSGLTGLVSSESEKSPADTIDVVMDAFAKSEDVKVTAHVAQSNIILPSDAAGVKKIDALGDANLRAAFDRANREIALDNQNTETGEQTNAMVVVTGQNNVGKADEIIEEAKSTGTQVFVVSTDKEITNDTENNLKKAAAETGGNLWASDGSNAKEIAETVTEAVKGQPAPEKGVKWGAILAALGYAAYAGSLVPWRKTMPIDRDGTPMTRRRETINNEGEL